MTGFYVKRLTVLKQLKLAAKCILNKNSVYGLDQYIASIDMFGKV